MFSCGPSYVQLCTVCSVVGPRMFSCGPYVQAWSIQFTLVKFSCRSGLVVVELCTEFSSSDPWYIYLCNYEHIRDINDDRWILLTSPPI